MASPLDHARRGAVLAIIAAVLLSNPLYLGLFVEEPAPRSPTGYTASRVDPATPEGQETIIRAVGSDEILDIDHLAEVNRYSPHGSVYRGANGSAVALRRARENGTTRVENGTVAFTLGRLAASYEFVAFHDDGDVRFYRFTVERTDGTTVVSVTNATRSAVARYILHQDVVLFTSLPEYQRETVTEVIQADRNGYRPSNDEFVQLTDNVVLKGDTFYVFREGIHVDDFGPSTRDLASIVLYALGLLLLLAAVASVLLASRAGPE